MPTVVLLPTFLFYNRARLCRQESDDSGVGDGSSGVSTRSRGRWGGSGVAAMRAEHEAEVTALKEEKQDMLLKYHATSSKLNEHERRCIDMGDEMERMQSQVVQLQVCPLLVIDGGNVVYASLSTSYLKMASKTRRDGGGLFLSGEHHIVSSLVLSCRNFSSGRYTYGRVPYGGAQLYVP